MLHSVCDYLLPNEDPVLGFPQLSSVILWQNPKNNQKLFHHSIDGHLDENIHTSLFCFS